MFAWMRLTNPEYIGELTGDIRGIGMLMVGCVLMVVGIVIGAAFGTLRR